ncbi:lytic transglycosylase domain-containing protein [Psychromonas sp. 14N.309.X.WAT.B.A12]|uniref:lytic transglycosylase domain-containing protein n=1 Tax=unclassified Psychromonas TaxID=2614957 RepID=UPI0025B09D91|nr:lytic transglycosylase domain-containing protein [Psychromonas sp. 14N.309.X.WAT.B.A12]MDN2663501.1 lytic transglycosylase domain-containing protein [Psychromonas sp. 14N.309.X.WAT.B.A12]
MKVFRSLFGFIALLLSGLFSTSHADIYMYTDKNGNKYFSERKENENYTLLLRSDTNKKPTSFRNWKAKSYTNISIPRDKTLQRKYHPIILKAAEKNQLDPAFLHAVITAESAYQRNAVSSAGAQGLMQLMPETAKRFSVTDAFDPTQNIYAGALYLKILLKEFKTRELAAAAYNAGEGAVRRYKRQIPPYPETQKYVSKVLTFYQYYQHNL